MIDRRKLLDLVDQLRAAVPAEVREANEILGHKEEALAKADEEAALRLSRADEEVTRRVSDSEIVSAAGLRAQAIVADAQTEAERLIEEGEQKATERAGEGGRLAAEQMDEADRYAVEMLKKLEQQLGAFTSSVRAGLQSLEKEPDPESEPASVAPAGPATYDPPEESR